MLLSAAQASVGVMVAVMALTGPMVVDQLGHQASTVFPIVGVSVTGMYALVIAVGDVVDRLGRTASLAGGLLVMGVSVSGLAWVESVLAIAAALVVAPGLWILRHDPPGRHGDGHTKRHLSRHTNDRQRRRR